MTAIAIVIGVGTWIVVFNALRFLGARGKGQA